MRFFGSVLMALGILVGIAVAGFVLLGGSTFGFTWLMSVAIAKVTFLGAIGLLGAGAVLHRIDRRRQNHALLERTTADPKLGE
jgi:hypothetical protein